MTIDASVQGYKYEADQLAVIEKYGFDLGIDGNDHFVLTDPVVRKAARGKGGKHVGGNLDILLRAAVAERKAHEQSASAPSDAVNRKNTRAKTNPPKAAEPTAPAVADAQSEPTHTDTPESKVTANAPKGVTARDTGRESRTAAAKPPKEKKENRYFKATKIIVDRPNITPEQLAKEAGFSVATAGHCFEAWNNITKVLAFKGLIEPQATIVADGKPVKPFAVALAVLEAQ